MKIPEQTFGKIAAQILALISAIIYVGDTVLGWRLVDIQISAILGVASAFLTLVAIVFYANNSTPNAAVTQLVAGAWRMGKREAINPTVEGVPHRVGAIRGVAPTPEQVRHYVEHEAGS